jgi:hypothetical protein
MERKTIDRFFMLLFLVMGILLFGISANTFDKMDSKCTTPVVYNGITTVMVVGAIMVTLSVSYFFCSGKNQCYTTNDAEDVTEFYLLVSSGLSLMITIILLAVGIKLKSAPSCNTNGVGTNVWFMFALSLLSFLISAGGAAYILQNREILLKN